MTELFFSISAAIGILAVGATGFIVSASMPREKPMPGVHVLIWVTAVWLVWLIFTMGGAAILPSPF